MKVETAPELGLKSLLSGRQTHSHDVYIMAIISAAGQEAEQHLSVTTVRFAGTCMNDEGTQEEQSLVLSQQTHLVL